MAALDGLPALVTNTILELVEIPIGNEEAKQILLQLMEERAACHKRNNF